MGGKVSLAGALEVALGASSAHYCDKKRVEVCERMLTFTQGGESIKVHGVVVLETQSKYLLTCLSEGDQKKNIKRGKQRIEICL